MLRVVMLVLLSVSLPAATAEACASCGAGDPTLTLAGTEQPFAGRLRLSVSAATSGTSSARAQMADRRLALGLAWAPASWAMLSAQAPLVWRATQTASLESDDGFGPGDLDLRARFVVLRDRALAPTHLVTLHVGAMVPLAPVLTDAQGVPLPDDAQTAAHTVAPLVGLAWSIYAAPFSLQSFALATIPVRGSEGLADPIELRVTSLAIVQVVPALSLVVGPELRARLDPTHATGGEVLFGTVGAMVGLGDVTPYVLARLPLAMAWDDAHHELPTLELGAAIDV